jgi:hypothetical protein
MTTTPWSREASPSETSPPPVPPAPSLPPTGAPAPVGFRRPPPFRRWLWVVLVLALVTGLSAAVGSVITYVAMRNDRAPTPASPQTVSPSAPVTPQFSAAEVTAAKQRLCQVFDVSVRGQEGKGGFRVEGNLNVPLTLRSLNSVSAVQNALVPAVPPDVASAARKYISTTLDVTTAAMGNTPTPEVNRLTDVDADAIYAFADVCGLPR